MPTFRKLAPAAIITLAFSCSAIACQPPGDMPSDQEERQAYWKRARTQWEQRVIASSPTLIVAKVSLNRTSTGELPSPEFEMSASLAPIKVLRGSPERSAVMVNANHMCDDFKVWVSDKGVYLLAMYGQKILLAEPLVEGQEQAGVSAFFTRISEPTLWK